uniref:Ribosomal protein S1 n=1 Tax=Gracilariopsis longissima TaxID=172976 RepID=A0A345U9T0_9FLOR|nr:ribosomal protein S1 [Gracilariopsis longissima]AXI97216.1 ribosomal protein S1 [Gracilariopsis longissima]UAD89132.1 ribosomal protein S1 [Gracilariopsis longissima]
MRKIIPIRFSEKDFGAILNQYDYSLHPGDIVAGTIFHKESKGYLVDIGANVAGYLPLEEILLNSFNNYDKYLLENFVNNTREFFILAYDQQKQQLLLSIKRLDYIRAWKRIKQLESEDLILHLPVSNVNKGGIITILEGLQSFIPKSHLISFPYDQSIIKNKIQCKFLFSEEKTNKLILSHKLAILSAYSNLLKIGSTVYGQVTQIKKYGIFISIYGIPALLHISEIGYTHIENINCIFQIGKKIKVKIIHIDMQQGRLSVSRREVN